MTSNPASRDPDRKQTGSRFLLAAAIVSFVGVGIPYWLVPYHALNLPNALLRPGLLVVALASLLLGCTGIVSFWKAIWVPAASVVLAVVARVLVDAIRDPTSHNLWPFEVAIAAVVGGLTALAGASAGRLAARVVGYCRAWTRQ